MGIPFWTVDENETSPQEYDADAWDRIEINNVVFADTTVEVDGDFGNDFDVKKAPGADGATLTNKGVEPMKPKVKWVIYSYRHWQSYQELIAAIQPKAGKSPLPLISCRHPQLQIFKKEQFRVERIHTLKKVGPQQLQAQLDLIEYVALPRPTPAPSVVPDRYSPERPRREGYNTSNFRDDFKPSQTNLSPKD